jgi:hypothetical protein
VAGSTRVDRLRPAGSGQPGSSSRPPDTAAATCQTGTSPSPNRAPSARAVAVTAASASAHTDPAGPGQHRIRRQRPTPAGEHHPHRLHPGREPAQPAAHRLRRPAQRGGDPPVPHAVRLRRQRQADHRGDIRAPGQHQHRQQHMRRPATGAPRPPRHHPHPAGQAADLPGPSMSPPSQCPRTSRTRQTSRTEPLLDRLDIDLYREHRASVRTHTALPRDSGQEAQREGRGPSRARRSSRWRRRRTRSTRHAHHNQRRHVQRRQAAATSSSSKAGDTQG